MCKSNRSTIQKDYADFLSSANHSVPFLVSERILRQVSRELNPPAGGVFLKLVFIHFAIGVFSLGFCPQFGVSLTSSMGFMHYLMQVGETVCMLGCGAFFTGVSLLAATFILRSEEVRVLRRNHLAQIGSLGTLSLGAFLCLGGEIVASLGAIWMLGAILGGAASLQVGWYFRKVVLQKVR